MHVRKGDTVVVIAGKEKGKRGRVLRVLTAKERVVIERVAMVKRHTKPTQANARGGILEKEGSVALSNVWPTGQGGTARRSEEAACVREVRELVRDGIAAAPKRKMEHG
jgi:ribosomal protein L24